MRELSLNVLDIAQNSISAKASLVTITVEENTLTHRLSITVKDNGCGMSKEKVMQVIDPFYTTRTTRKVGLGIPFFKMGAEMTGGEFSIHSQEGKGTTIKAVFCTDHIDCMPLGDICATIGSLIQLNPTVDFLYTYSCDERSFVADTRQFKEVLEGLPIDAPQVTEFIEQYLLENTAEVQRGVG